MSCRCSNLPLTFLFGVIASDVLTWIHDDYGSKRWERNLDRSLITFGKAALVIIMATRLFASMPV